MSNPVLDYGWEASHVTGDALVHSGKCVLHSIIVNGLTTVGDITVRNGIDATGAIVGILHLNTAVSVSVQPLTFLYDIELNSGIYIDYDGSVAADLTVTFK